MSDVTEKVSADVPAAINTTYATVVVYGHELMAKRDLEILAACLNGVDKDAGARVVKYRDDNYPKSGDKAILANCFPDVGGIAINLQETLAQAIATCQRQPERSVWAEFNMQMILNYLHEMAHLMPRVKVEDRVAMDGEKIEDEEEMAHIMANESILKLAKAANIEPGHPSEYPWFAKTFISTVADMEDKEWVGRQTKMLEDHTTYVLPADKEGKHTGLTLSTLKAYIAVAYGQDPDSEEWKATPLAEVLKPVEVATPTVAIANTVMGGNVADDEAFYEDDEPHAAEVAAGFGAFAMPNATPVVAAPVATQPLFQPQPVQLQPAIPTTFTQFAAPQPAPSNMQPSAGFATNFPVAGGAPAAATATAMQPEVLVYPQTGLSDEQTAQICTGVYAKIYNHIFTQCGRVLNNDVGFQYPEAVATLPIKLTPQEMAVVVKSDCLDANGRWCPNTPTSNGELRGQIMRQAKLPAYRLYINHGGHEVIRLLMPQNPAKRGADGNYSKPALQARGGSCIMYVMEGNDALAQATGRKYVLKVVDGQILPQ